MATITGLTADRMLEIEGASVVDGEVDTNGNLILTTHDGTTINAGPVVGPQGAQGPMGPSGVASIPGEIKLWPGAALPTQAQYGKWVWADGAVYVVATYPLAAGNIAPAWKTFGGASDPGASNFRVPDLRGLVPAGLDAMPGGSRANRMTRSIAITLAGRTGEEQHIIAVSEMAAHAHTVNNHNHGGGYHGHGGGNHAHTYARAVHSLAQGGQAESVGGTDSHDIATDASGNIIAPETVVGYEAPGTNSLGGNVAHENVQPTVFVPYIVRLDG
jgi:microcystin-dependent protein